MKTTGLIEVEGILIREEEHQMKEGILIEIEDLQEEGDHKMMEHPMMDMEDSQSRRTPNDGEPPYGNGGPPRCPDRRGPPGPRGPPGLVRPVIVQQPQVVLDTTSLENTFDTMGQSMLQLARVQDQMNCHLQQHIHQGQLNM